MTKHPASALLWLTPKVVNMGDVYDIRVARNKNEDTPNQLKRLNDWTMSPISTCVPDIWDVLRSPVAEP
jgi:Cu/Ag efflux pump CusA